MPGLIWVWVALLTQTFATAELASTALAVQNVNETSARCNRELSRQARAILEKYVFKHLGDRREHLPESCPLHPAQDMLAAHEHHKVRKSGTQWRCSYCNKVFKSEPYIDMHLQRKHADQMPKGTCLADLCDVLQCDWFAARKRKGSSSGSGSGSGRSSNKGRSSTSKDKDWTGTHCLPHEVTRKRQACQDLATRCFPVSQVTHHHALFEPHHHHWEAAHEFMQKYFCQAATCNLDQRDELLTAVITASSTWGRTIVLTVLLLAILFIFYAGLYAYSAVPSTLRKGSSSKHYKKGQGQYNSRDADPAGKLHRKPNPAPHRTPAGSTFSHHTSSTSVMATVGKGAALGPARMAGQPLQPPPMLGFLQTTAHVPPPPTHPPHSHTSLSGGGGSPMKGHTSPAPSSHSQHQPLPPQAVPEVAKVMHGGAAGAAAASGAVVTQRAAAAAGGSSSSISGTGAGALQGPPSGSMLPLPPMMLPGAMTAGGVQGSGPLARSQQQLLSSNSLNSGTAGAGTGVGSGPVAPSSSAGGAAAGRSGAGTVAAGGRVGTTSVGGSITGAGGSNSQPLGAGVLTEAAAAAAQQGTGVAGKQRAVVNPFVRMPPPPPPPTLPAHTAAPVGGAGLGGSGMMGGSGPLLGGPGALGSGRLGGGGSGSLGGGLGSPRSTAGSSQGGTRGIGSTIAPPPVPPGNGGVLTAMWAQRGGGGSGGGGSGSHRQHAPDKAD